MRENTPPPEKKQNPIIEILWSLIEEKPHNPTKAIQEGLFGLFVLLFMLYTNPSREEFFNEMGLYTYEYSKKIPKIAKEYEESSDQEALEAKYAKIMSQPFRKAVSNGKLRIRYNYLFTIAERKGFYFISICNMNFTNFEEYVGMQLMKGKLRDEFLNPD